MGRPDVWFPPPQTVFLMLERLAVPHCDLIVCSRLGGVQRNMLSENVDAFKTGGSAQQMHAWVRKEYSFLSLSVCSHHSPCSMVFRQGPSRASHCPAELGKSSPNLDPNWRRIHHFRSFKEIASGIDPLAYPNEPKSRLHSDAARVVFPGGYIRATFVCEAFWVPLGVLRSIRTNLVSRFGKTSLTSLFLYYEDTTIILHVGWLADKVLLTRHLEQC